MARLTETVHHTIQNYLYVIQAFEIPTLCMHYMDISSHNLCSDLDFSTPHIRVLIIQLSQHYN